MKLLAAESIVPHLTDYPVPGLPVTAHQALLIVVSIFMIALFVWAAKKVRPKPERKGPLALLEMTMIFVRDDIVYPWLGEERGRKFLPFFWTLFFFILLMNLVGMLPFPFNPWGRTPTGNLAVTGALAVIVFVMVQVMGMAKHGAGKYWTNLVPRDIPKLLKPMFFVIELMTVITRPFALTVRLFANMVAGHALLLVLFGFLLGIQSYASAVIGVPITLASFGFILFIMLLEVLVIALQAYIFTLLSAIYVNLAVSEGH